MRGDKFDKAVGNMPLTFLDTSEKDDGSGK